MDANTGSYGLMNNDPKYVHVSRQYTCTVNIYCILNHIYQYFILLHKELI